MRDVTARRRSGVLLSRIAAAELIGTALLLMAIVGSGLAAQRLSPGDTCLELLEDAGSLAVSRLRDRGAAP